ncbi:hypothetical protein BOW53_11855 [Solemya pervernicosa gill symbiont]|uniref:Uncharacterized protein n=1 Tax=Solemya pervernicosa gill symbiont TaxID=642797 RepID=A0A1T2L2U8_9GAMM|nr:hypothetical protein [Solemya pervernicosa gill symbiont]OOZ39394.1 hypothetical protein BOW53_11855 [Solemya pervernicosa gill symbiont]
MKKWIAMIVLAGGLGAFAVWANQIPPRAPVDFKAKLACLKGDKTKCDHSADWMYLEAFESNATSGNVSLSDYREATKALEAEKARLSHSSWERDAPRWKRWWFKLTDERL